MRRKTVSYGLIIPVVAGLIAVLNMTNPSFTPPLQPQAPAPSSATPKSQAGTSPQGTVVTNDENSTGSPKQDSRDQPAYEVEEVAAQKRNPKTAAAPRAKTDKTVVINNKEYPLRTYTPLALPNDPLASQWWVGNTKLDQAWDTPRGNNQTVLAIIDTGFGLKHEEFTNRWHNNASEMGVTTQENPSSFNCTDRGLALSASCNLIDDNSDGIVDNEVGTATYQNPSRRNCTDQLKPLDKICNRVDDDANGYVDDVTGWDFINFDNSAQAGELNPTGTGTTHGTLVAGVAAATGNNSKGIAGVDWGTKILPIQALDDDSYGDTLSVGRSIFYAVQQKVDVISLSLGSSLSDPYVREAVQAALEAGIVVVAASGNDGCDCIVYPANYPEVVAVGALGQDNLPAYFSSYGQNLDVLAPGVNLTSPTWQSTNGTAAYSSGINGTSFATPMVAGMMTRLLSHQPTATPSQLTAAITESVNRLSLSPTTPHNLKYGFGTLDALKSTGRMTTAYNSAHLYSLSPISTGNKLSSTQPAEPLTVGRVYVCEPGSTPSTAVHELSKNGGSFFSISKAEMHQAINAGYISSRLTYACVQQPHDTATTVRNIDVFHEFRNIYSKL